MNGPEMPSDLDDRLDRNNRTISAGNDALSEKLQTLQTAVAVIATKVEALTETVKTGLFNVDTTFRDFNSRYATQADLEKVREEVKDMGRNINRGVWIVLTAVIVGALSLVFKAGLVHAS